MIQNMIRDGLYTLNVSDSNNVQGADGKTPRGTTSNVVVKNVIDDAKKVLSNQGNPKFRLYSLMTLWSVFVQWRYAMNN